MICMGRDKHSGVRLDGDETNPMHSDPPTNPSDLQGDTWQIERVFCGPHRFDGTRQRWWNVHSNPWGLLSCGRSQSRLGDETRLDLMRGASKQFVPLMKVTNAGGEPAVFLADSLDTADCLSGCSSWPNSARI